MNQSDFSPELKTLLMEVFNGTLDSEADRQLQERLRADLHAMSLYIHFCEMHAALSWEHGQVMADITPAVVEHKTQRTRPALLLWMIAITAKLFVIASIGWLLRDSNTIPNGPVVASIEQIVHATIFAGECVWTLIDIRTGRYVLNQGLVQIKYASGVSLYQESIW